MRVGNSLPKAVRACALLDPPGVCRRGRRPGLPWSNGPVEGQSTRLKTIKRQMYGRANFDLLRARVLWAA
jgi:Transposase